MPLEIRGAHVLIRSAQLVRKTRLESALATVDSVTSLHTIHSYGNGHGEGLLTGGCVGTGETELDACACVRKQQVYSSSQGCHTATGTHMPHGITQRYLPPGRGDIPALTPAEAGTRLSDPRGMQG